MVHVAFPLVNVFNVFNVSTVGLSQTKVYSQPCMHVSRIVLGHECT